MTPRSPTAQTRPTRPLPLYVLLAALIFQGLSGVGGGIGLLSDPTGEALGIPLVWLEGSPFTDYSVPGVVLLTLLGVGPLLAAWGVWRRVAWSRGAAGVVGLALLVWLLVEIAVIGWQPSHRSRPSTGSWESPSWGRPSCPRCASISDRDSGDPDESGANSYPRGRHGLVGTGRLDRPAILEGIRRGPRWRSVSMSDAVVKRPSAWLALVSYEAEAVRDGDDEPYRAYVSSVYVETGGGWKLALHQHSTSTAG